jgi:hypothetical protein
MSATVYAQFSQISATVYVWITHLIHSLLWITFRLLMTGPSKSNENPFYQMVFDKKRDHFSATTATKHARK